MTTNPEHHGDEPPIADELRRRCERIELLILDVDGVLTDGRIIIDDRGVQTRRFHVRDGLGLAVWRLSGKRSAIISGRSAEAVNRRAEELKIDRVYQGVDDKGGAFRSLLEELELPADRVCHMGDDLNDLPALLAAGLAACPADAAAEVRGAAHLVARSAGGAGAVREVIETILKVQGLWRAACERYRAPTT